MRRSNKLRRSSIRLILMALTHFASRRFVQRTILNPRYIYIYIHCLVSSRLPRRRFLSGKGGVYRSRGFLIIERCLEFREETRDGASSSLDGFIERARPLVCNLRERGLKMGITRRRAARRTARSIELTSFAGVQPVVILSLRTARDRAFPWACYSRPTSAPSILLRDSSSLAPFEKLCTLDGRKKLDAPPSEIALSFLFRGWKLS